MTAPNNLFKTKLEGAFLKAALELRELNNCVNDTVSPLLEKRKALISEIKEIEGQIEYLYESFDKARVSFFEHLGQEMGADLGATSLDYSDDGSVSIQRTEEDLERRAQIERLRENPLAALAELVKSEPQACEDPECSTCHPSHTIH